jgi:hypothetical protein
MKVDFNQLPEESRLWVYQAERKLTEKELAIVQQKLDEFTDSWEAHGKPLRASYNIEFDQFVVLAVDEGYNMATGCSIDSSVSIMRHLESLTGISFLSKSQVAVIYNDEIKQLPLSGIKTAISEGQITESYKVINNHVSSLKDWRSSFIQPVAESWMKRYF